MDIPIDTTPGKKVYQTLAQELLDKRQPGIYNQAIMDFGAVICKPQNPLCRECVQKLQCVAFKKDLVKQLPVKSKMLVRKERWMCYFIVQVEGKVYIRQRTGKDIWENLYEFVLQEMEGPLQNRQEARTLFMKLAGKEPLEMGAISKLFTQQLTHQKIHGQFITITLSHPLTTLPGYRLVTRKQLSRYAFPRLLNSFLKEGATQTQLF